METRCKRSRGRARWALLGATAIVAALGCAGPQYVYRPVEQATAVEGDVPAARYAIPPERPLGSARVASFGVSELSVNDEDVPVLQARLVIANNGDGVAWVVDTQRIEAELPGGMRLRAAFVNAPGAPNVVVPRGTERAIDLFFRLPPGMAEAEDIPAFSLLWHVRTADRVIEERTPFSRAEVTSPPPSVSVVYGTYWWYDPLFYTAPVIVAPRFYGGPVRYYAPSVRPSPRYYVPARPRR